MEKHYITFYNSYENGYNTTVGGNTFPNISEARKGESNGRALMKKTDVLLIRQMWANKIPYREAWEYWKNKCPSERCFQKIWRRETWKDVGAELITQDLIEWHRTSSKVLEYNQVHNSILNLEEIEEIKKEKDCFKSAAEYYRSHPLL